MLVIFITVWQTSAILRYEEQTQDITGLITWIEAYAKVTERSPMDVSLIKLCVVERNTSFLQIFSQGMEKLNPKSSALRVVLSHVVRV
jgi:hypothetical protein